ncbi:MAG TPA: alpha/beta fold hydrolase [Candidatus Angelobacter sp.]|nr:alpha/beta fold hydrolase [Candidatus Angelobacter sp.]
MRKTFKIVLLICLGYLLFAVAAGVIIGDASVHLFRRPLRHRAQAAALVSQNYGAELQDVSITPLDGAVLKAWYVRPQSFNGSAVILLHGITDNREGVAGYGKLLLDHGYAVLLPDARRHGESGGDLATYGVKESDDIHRWVNWLYAHDLSPGQCVYGFGESYGAALMLQSLAAEPRYCAVVVESPFSTAREMSFERISGPLHLGPWFGKTIGRPIVDTAVLYARWRYGVDLFKPSPLDAVEHSTVPVLLIHGERDRNISPRHSLMLARSAPDHVQLWLVPKAGHTAAWAAAHQEFEARVLGWFQSHSAHAPGSPQVRLQ